MEYANILVAEDEGIVAKDLMQRLQNMGHTVIAIAASGKDVMQKSAEMRPDLVLMDIHLQGELDGIDTASELRVHYDVPVVYLTAHADSATLRRAKITEPFGYVLKPFDERELQVTIEMALYKHKMERQLREYTLKLNHVTAELEQRVLERTEQLSADVNKVSAFSYAIAQDFRTPLHAVTGFSGLLLHAHAPKLPAKAQEYIQRNGEQFEQLLTDVLTFIRLNREALNTQTVAPAALVREVLADLQSNQAHRHVDVRIAELPSCEADHALLTQVFRHLLSNALKFTQSRAVARIEVGTCHKQGQCVYFVKDNGIGFDQHKAAKLFEAFEQLHPIDQFEGHGLGLALVQRIIHSHGGQVWAEGIVDQGATFSFTLG